MLSNVKSKDEFLRLFSDYVIPEYDEERQTFKHVNEPGLQEYLKIVFLLHGIVKKQIIHYLINWRKVNNLSRLNASKILGITKPEFYKITQSPYIRGTSYESFDLEYLMNLVDKTKATITLTID